MGIGENKEILSGWKEDDKVDRPIQKRKTR